MRRIYFVLAGHLFLLGLLCCPHPTQHQLKVTHHLVDTCYVVNDAPMTHTSIVSLEIPHEEPTQVFLQKEPPPAPQPEALPKKEPPAPPQPQVPSKSPPVSPPSPKTLTQAPPKPPAKAAVKSAAQPTATKPKPTVQAPAKSKPQATQPTQYQALASLMENSLKTLETPKPSYKPTSNQKISLGSLHCDTMASSYRDQLVAILEDVLMFPEAGDVSVEIKILPSGKIATCTVLKSLSAANEAYVLKVLPTLSLPPCTELKKEESSKTLRLTLVGRSHQQLLLK